MQTFVQKFVRGLVMALAVLLGGFHAEAGTVPMTPDGFVDLSKFDELEKLVIVKIAENMLYDSINNFPENLDAADGSLGYRKAFAFSFALLASEADRAGLKPLAKWNGFKAMNMQENIRGKLEYSKALHCDDRIEGGKQKYFESVQDLHADKKGLALPPEEMEEYSRRIKDDILAIVMEKVFGKT